MADDVPHGGGSPRMGEELEYIPLPPRPKSHLSRDGPEADSRFTRRYGSTMAREWYMNLPDGVRQIVDDAGFGLFCMGLSCLMASRTLLGALVERWWDTTNSFHFSITRDMMMTPYDFAMLTGLGVGGQPIPYDSDMGEWEAAWTYLLGAHPPIFRGSGLVHILMRYNRIPNTHFAFCTFCILYFMHIAHILCFSHYLCLFVFSLPPSCFSQLWVYAYFPTLASEAEVKMPLKVPYSHRYDSRCQPRARETLPYLCQYFDTSLYLLSADHIAALGGDARWYQISFCWGSGCLSISTPAANAPSLSRALVADVSSTSRARSPRGEVSEMPPTKHSVGWPDLPTELTGWRYSGMPYQIPLEPPLPDCFNLHLQPSVGYVEGLLEVLAIFKGMTLRRETMLSSHGIQ
ncbi:Protein MAIN-LIKE 2, partial [Camellia lanceoleosa]